MSELNFDNIEELYDDGKISLKDVYSYCGSDLDMYNFLSCHCGYGEELIKRKMKEVSGSDDAYYNVSEEQ